MTNNIKRVALFADFLSEMGGVEYYISQLASSLKGSGIEVRVYTGTQPENKYWINLLEKNNILTYYTKFKYTNRKDRTPEKQLVLKLIKEFNFWNLTLYIPALWGNWLKFG